MIEDYDLYLAQIIEKINIQKSKKRTSLYEMDVEFISLDKRNEICSRVKQYFSGYGIGVEVKYCQQCGGRKADIIITFSL